MNISLSLALSMAGPIHPSRHPSHWSRNNNSSDSASTREFSLYKGISDRPLGWKPRRSTKSAEAEFITPDMRVRRWDGAARGSTDWDGLRKDPELWYPDGNCLVHLYARGQSRRGPAFRVPFSALLATKCRPLLDRFLVEDLTGSPLSDRSSSEDGWDSGQRSPANFELYIPAPPAIAKDHAFLYHIATRNFFAWVFGKSLVSSHLGSALVGLLNSMNEFRSTDVDNVLDIMDYMDEEGYADMRNQPDHALGILFFAEQFRFKDLWISAFAHCTGMHEKLTASPGFEYMSRKSRALVTRSRLEMNVRLEKAGTMLGSFLSDDLSDTHLYLSAAARSHMDKFRSFLQAYYIAKLGYYPPRTAAFPKNIYGQMCSEFQKLYDFLVDSKFSSSDDIPTSQQGGICVFQSVQAFDASHNYKSLPHPLPLLPEGEDAPASKSAMSRRLSWAPRSDKMKADPRLVTFASLSKATNRHQKALFNCSLVRTYQGFEKECIFSPSKGDKHENLSQADARKVRWILIYSILQTLLSVTKVPEEVRDTQNVPYNMCVLTAGCPPWKTDRPIHTLLRSQTDQTREDFVATLARPSTLSDGIVGAQSEIKPDIDYFARTHQTQHSRKNSAATIGPTFLKKENVKKALTSLGTMPELRHPRPRRATFHEILVHGYGNGTNSVSITEDRPLSIQEEEESPRKHSSDSASSSEDLSTGWSNYSIGAAAGCNSSRTSVSSTGRRGSGSSSTPSKKSINEFLDRPLSPAGLVRVTSSVYSKSEYDDTTILQPNPLLVSKD